MRPDSRLTLDRIVLLDCLCDDDIAQARASGSHERGSPRSADPRNVSSTGPRVDVAITSHIKGKPPHETFVTEMRVRNPLTVPVWLLYDVGDSFPSIVTSVEPRSRPPRPAAHVWSFSGDGGFETVRIPGDGQIILRHRGALLHVDQRPSTGDRLRESDHR